MFFVMPALVAGIHAFLSKCLSFYGSCPGML